MFLRECRQQGAGPGAGREQCAGRPPRRVDRAQVQQHGGKDEDEGAVAAGISQLTAAIAQMAAAGVANDQASGQQDVTRRQKLEEEVAKANKLESLGVLAGAGLGVLGTGNDPDFRIVSVTGLAGMAAGLTLSFYLTRNWDADEKEEQRAELRVAPVAGGAMGMLHVEF